MVEGDGLVRGALPERLTEMLMLQAEVARAAVPWISGDVDAPLVQLEALASTLGALELLTKATLDEARTVYVDQRRHYAVRAA